MIKKFEYEDWVLYVDNTTSTIEVIKDEETRFYDIKGPIVDSKQDEELKMYIDVHVKNGNFYQFKFDENNALIGDIYDKNSKFIDTFGCYYFGEDYNPEESKY